MTREELRNKMDKLCDEQGESCVGCPCQDFDVCNIAEEELTAEDYAKGVEALESHEKSKMGESTTDTSKTPLHATHKPTQGSEYDVVGRPQHYASTSIECIDAMVETQGVESVYRFCLCNAFKYLWRHRAKNQFEDIKKASWYLNKAVELYEGKKGEK